MATEEQNDTSERTFKVLVVGEYGVGKTSIIRRFTEGVFHANYRLTIGVDFASKSLKWDDSTVVNLQLWDIAGHERFGSMTRVYYKHAIGAFLVYDLTRPATFEASIKWLNDINAKVVLPNGEPIPVVLLANKCELSEETLSEEALQEFCKKHGIRTWFITSAKDNINIETSIRKLVSEMLDLGESALSREFMMNSVEIPAYVEPANEVSADEEDHRCCVIL